MEDEFIDIDIVVPTSEEAAYARTNNRIDELIVGFTEGGGGTAEVIDIRNGVDDTVYSTAGEAVRSQITNVQEEITSKNEELTDKITSTSEELTTKITSINEELNEKISQNTSNIETVAAAQTDTAADVEELQNQLDTINNTVSEIDGQVEKLSQKIYTESENEFIVSLGENKFIIEFNDDGTVGWESFTPLENTSTTSAEKINLNESVTVHCSATGGTTPYKYSVFYKKEIAETWSSAKKDTEDTEIEVTPLTATKYNILCEVKDAKNRTAQKQFDLTVENPLSMDFNINDDEGDIII